MASYPVTTASGKLPIHDRAGSLQHAGVNVGTVGQKAPHPLSMDVGAPKRNIQVPVGQTQKNIPKAGRIEDVGVQQRRQRPSPIAGRVPGRGLSAHPAPRGGGLPSRAGTRGHPRRGHGGARPPSGRQSAIVEQLHQVRP